MLKRLHFWFGIGPCRKEWITEKLYSFNDRMHLRAGAEGVTITHVGGCRG